MTRLLKGSIAKSTSVVYRRAWALLVELSNKVACNVSSVPKLPLSVGQVSFYIASMHVRGYAPSTMITYVSAIGYLHKISGFSDPTREFVIQKLLAGAAKIAPSVDPRLPVTHILLHRLIEDLPHYVSAHYNRVLIAAMFSVAFFGLFRVGELTVSKFGDVLLHLKDLKVQGDHFVISIAKYKHSKSNTAIQIPIERQSDTTICPVTLLFNYLSLRGTSPGPLFMFTSGSHVPRQFFTKTLSGGVSFIGLQPSLYKSHSFRIGGASHLASLGFSDAQIRMRGRWESDAFKRYIRAFRAGVYV